MKNLYDKSKIKFSLIWIIIYVVGASLADALSAIIGIEKCVTVVFLLILTIILLNWLLKHNLNVEYGLCKPTQNPKYFLYYIPLVVLISVNLWFGISVNFGLLESLLYATSMLLVGFVEELIFRGFLFKALQENSLKTAVIVSSITFGMGHIINLFSGANTINTICQIFYAITTGFLFVIIFYKSKSLLPCIITHSLFNALSTISNTVNISTTYSIIIALAIMAITIVYSVIIIKLTPKNQPTIINEEQKKETA